MMKTLTYWQRRLQNPLHQAYNENEQATRAWLTVYEQAKKDIEAELFHAYSKINKPNPLISDFYRYNHLQKIEKQIEQSILELGAKEDDFTKSALRHATKLGSQTVSSVLQIGVLNKSAIDQMVKQPWAGGNYSDRIWKNKAQLIASMKSELTSGIIQGKSIYQVANMMDARLQVGRSQIQRLVRTEYMHALNQGQIETYRSNGYTKLRWVATMDDKTSDICRKRNGKEYSIDNLPDIPAHPNCRCTLVPVISQAMIDEAADEILQAKQYLKTLLEVK
ncbi:minor capsid protein [Enterococcus gallinarum]|uniref:minor capsid protein n=1 Tax=Enterococcus gallinarum TaxID=1353 RepID=UPI002047DAB9|nr:MAG TPA: minor capsid protein [Caudoviricetes sp.]